MNIDKAVRADTDLLKVLASVHLSFGQTQTAKDLLGLALWLDPGNVETSTLLARSHARLGDIRTAADILRQTQLKAGRLTQRDTKLLKNLEAQLGAESVAK